MRRRWRETRAAPSVIVPRRKGRVVLVQARRIVLLFGGVPALAYALREVGHPVKPITIHQWVRLGLIPNKHWRAIFQAAAQEGVVITSEDFDPRRLHLPRKRKNFRSERKRRRKP